MKIAVVALVSSGDAADTFISNSGPSQAGGGLGGFIPPTPPQFLADQFTLSRPGWAHYPHPLLLAPPDFHTLRRP